MDDNWDPKTDLAPAPWFWHEDIFEGLRLMSDSPIGTIVQAIPTNRSNRPTLLVCGEPEKRAIAAAPDLLAACKAALKVWPLSRASLEDVTDPQEREAWYLLRAATHKAEGEEK